MKFSDTWIKEMWRLGAIYCVALVIGILIGQKLFMLLLVSVAFIVWQMTQLYSLERWLNNGLDGEPRHSYGLWDQIFYRLYRTHQRQKKRRSKLKKQLAEFQDAAAAIPDAIVIMNKQFVIERFNVTATYLLGLQIPQDIGQRLLNLVRNPLLSEYIRAGVFEDRIQISAPINQNIILSVRIIRYGGGRMMLVARDVTYMEKLKIMRRDFLANVSHELRTPITVVSGYLETIRDLESISKDTLQKPLEQIHHQTARMESLISDLMQLARLESSSSIAPHGPVNVLAMIERLTHDAEMLSKDKHHKFVVEFNQDNWLQGDEVQIFSAFSNLVNNAVRYTPNNGTITLRWWVEQHQASFEVKDTGIGISAKHIPRLTERFYRVDVGRSRHTGGTGLGLAIVKHILERHQAHLLVESTPHVGSTFRCIFPVERIMSSKKTSKTNSLS